MAGLSGGTGLVAEELRRYFKNHERFRAVVPEGRCPLFGSSRKS